MVKLSADIYLKLFSCLGWDKLWAGRQNSALNQPAIDQIQRTIQCCGSTTLLDYGATLPSSCCDPEASSCNQLYAYKTGCRSQIKGTVANSASWIAYLSLAMAVVEVSFFSLSCAFDDETT
jgi:CD63 antigen